jgi:hypothetical protein
VPLSRVPTSTRKSGLLFSAAEVVEYYYQGLTQALVGMESMATSLA